MGLPEGKPGNAGIGTLVFGAGKRQYRNVVRINQEIKNGSFEKNEVLAKILSEVTSTNGRIHFIGCITDSQEDA